MTETLEGVALRPMDCEDRWAWVFRVWLLVGLAWIVQARARLQENPGGSVPGEGWLRDHAAALDVSPRLLALAIAVSEGREPLLAPAGSQAGAGTESEALAVPAAFALLAFPPFLHRVLLRAILRRCLFLLDDKGQASFGKLAVKVVRPILRKLRAALCERTEGASDAAAFVRDEVARLRKALVRVLAVVVVSQRERWLGPDAAERLPVNVLVRLVRAEAADRASALEKVRGAVSRKLSLTRICEALKDGLRAPSSSKPRNPTTVVARQQQELVDGIEVLDESTRAAGLALAWFAVPLSLLPGRAARSDSRLTPWRPDQDWWRLACACTARVGHQLIPALRDRLWPIQAAGS